VKLYLKKKKKKNLLRSFHRVPAEAAPPTPIIEVDLCSHLSQKNTHVAAVAQNLDTQGNTR
jgi:hypothetical protein